MLALAALAEGRRQAQALMVDRCVIRRTTGAVGALDPDTGLRPAAQTTTVYSGRCKVQTYEAFESKPEAGEHVFTVQRYTLHLPVDAGPPAVDDRVEITASEMAPHLVGKTYRISGTHTKSLATAQRLLIDEVTG